MKQIEKMYMHYKQDVYAYLMSITHNSALSEDLLQETFLKAIHSISNFRGNSSVKTWLFGIARHLWLQHLRKAKDSLEYSDLLQIYISDSFENSLATKETINRIYELLGTKDERTQRIVHMRAEGYSYSEISENVGIAENSARVIDFRIKQWLKTILEKEELI